MKKYIVGGTGGPKDPPPGGKTGKPSLLKRFINWLTGKDE